MSLTAAASRAAYAAKKSTAWIDRQRILEYVRTQGINGATCDQTEVALGMSHQTCSARFSEMGSMKNPAQSLFPSGELRPTRTGHRAVVFVTKEFR